MSTALPRRRFMQTAVVGAAAAAGLGQGTAQAQAAKAADLSAALTVGLRPEDATRPPFAAPSQVRPLLIADLNDLEAEAQKVMDPGAFAFISSGADSQWTLRENRASFGRVAIKPNYLVGKPAPDTRINLLGQSLAVPIITTPMGAHGLAHQSAELGTARGTAEAGSLYTMSTMANHTIEELGAATKGPSGSSYICRKAVTKRWRCCAGWRPQASVRWCLPLMRLRRAARIRPSGCSFPCLPSSSW